MSATARTLLATEYSQPAAALLQSESGTLLLSHTTHLVAGQTGFYVFMVVLSREVRTVQKDLHRQEMGLEIRKVRLPVYKRRNSQLRALVRDYDNMPREVFLRRVAKKLTRA